MLTAFEAHPDVHWVIVACDLVHFNEETLRKLLSHHGEKIITSFKNAEKGFPEPLCAVYSPEARELFKKALNDDIRCPVKVLKSAEVNLLDQSGEVNLANINTPEERHGHH
jgi:cyclic pyranopterin phosphate synthase